MHAMSERSDNGFIPLPPEPWGRRLGRARADVAHLSLAEATQLVGHYMLTSDATISRLESLAELRVSEIAALRGEDVDLDNAMLMVRCGKGGKDDPVPLAPVLADELALWPRSGPLFRSKSGAAIAARIRTAYRRLGIVARPHDLRHSFGTEAARTSGDLRAVQRLMRHRSIATTERYVDYWPSGGDIVAGMYGGDAA